MEATKPQNEMGFAHQATGSERTVSLGLRLEMEVQPCAE